MSKKTLGLLDTKVGAVAAIAAVGVVGIWYVKYKITKVVGVASDVVGEFVNGTQEQQIKRKQERDFIESIGG